LDEERKKGTAGPAVVPMAAEETHPENGRKGIRKVGKEVLELANRTLCDSAGPNKRSQPEREGGRKLAARVRSETEGGKGTTLQKVFTRVKGGATRCFFTPPRGGKSRGKMRGREKRKGVFG